MHDLPIVRRSEHIIWAIRAILDYHKLLVESRSPMKAKSVAPVRSQPGQPFQYERQIIRPPFSRRCGRSRGTDQK